jgi:hypothetical protein
MVYIKIISVVTPNCVTISVYFLFKYKKCEFVTNLKIVNNRIKSKKIFIPISVHDVRVHMSFLLDIRKTQLLRVHFLDTSVFTVRISPKYTVCGAHFVHSGPHKGFLLCDGDWMCPDV